MKTELPRQIQQSSTLYYRLSGYTRTIQIIKNIFGKYEEQAETYKSLNTKKFIVLSLNVATTLK